MRAQQFTFGLTLAALASTLGACGDFAGSTGDLGRIDYWLYTDYVLEDWSLTDVSILTGHSQQINTELTMKGESEYDNKTITHMVTPSVGVTVEHDDLDDRVSDLLITVEQPGTYTVDSLIDGHVFDTIDLEFDTPTTLDQITFVRAPADDDFVEDESASPTVEEGSQVAFLPIPLDASGLRIAGDISVGLSADPEDMIVEGSNVLGVYEQGVYTSSSPTTIYFVDSGAVTITLTDDPNAVSASTTFTVEEL